MEESKTEEPKKKLNKGGLNLIILGVLASFIAILTTSISLIIYHNSGDIYLDRSRPGFLPDEEEIEEEGDKEEEYIFEKTGKLEIKNIEEYLQKLDAEIKAIDSYEKPFSSDVLSDKHLGISE
ncbi:hypothetical protein IKG41_01335 [Candidatus Saccharibacteria bacterium]|nr:hypothetical protein [Candidatus Saccharibacteria bacterium]